MSVREAAERDIEAIRKVDPKAADSVLAASMLNLADTLDNPQISATSRAACAKVILETADRLRTLAPTEAKKGRLDELTERRNARRGAN